LACNFVVVSDCQDFFDEFDVRIHHASQDFPASRCHRLEGWRNDRGYSLKEDGRELDPQSDAKSAAEAILWRIQELSIAALPEFTKIHAGCASWRGKRFVMAGPARAGKTTLMTRMLYEGFAVYCDDIVLLRRGEVLPYPRRLWIRAEAIRLIPQIVPFVSRSRKMRNHFSVDPTELGFNWHLEEAPVHAVFFLEPNHGADTRLEEYPKYAMAQRIMSESNLPAAGAHAWIKDVVAMVDSASSYLLRCGDLDSAIEAVKSVLER